jgi:ArsR family metal-binding transcriptional regulator
MDYRRLADVQDEDEAMEAPHEIPDVAAEAAQSGGAVAREPAETARLTPQKLSAVLDEIETCYRVLSSAND